jgi:Fur family zinc uptake transcriptional regulator
MSFVEESLKILKENAYKLTSPRRAVLAVLEKAETPLSVYDIEERIPEEIPVNVVTIYRILDVFEDLGIIHRIHTKEGYIKCEFEEKKGCHYFAVCRKCGHTSEFLQEKCRISPVIPKDLPFVRLKHLSELSGVCRECAETATINN